MCPRYYLGSCTTFDMDNPSRFTRFEVPHANSSYGGAVLLSLPEERPFFALTLRGEHREFLGFNLAEAAAPVELDWSDTRWVRAYGSSWIEEEGTTFSPMPSPDGNLLFRAYPAFPPLGMKIPDGLKGKKDALVIDVRNGTWTVLRPTERPWPDPSRRSTELFILKEGSPSGWKTLKIEGNRPFVRGFDNDWLAIIIAQQNREARREPPDVRRSTGVPAEVVFAAEGYRVPGRLLLYNMRTQQQFEITTGVPDSEVLLVREHEVFYRSAANLYRATIDEHGLKEPELLVNDEKILDVHWAFWGSAERSESQRQKTPRDPGTR